MGTVFWYERCMADGNTQRLRRYAKTMRSEATVGERLLWRQLRARRLGVKFRRQVPLGPFIPDFVCHAARLIVEVDGDSHDDSARDRQRDRWFLDPGWFVLRFSGEDVANDMGWVLGAILLALQDPSQIHDPLNIHWRGLPPL